MEVKDLPTLYNRIQLQISKRKLVELLQEQLDRDFTRANMECFKLNTDVLDNAIFELSQRLNQLNQQDLTHLLYIADIPETQFTALNNTAENSMDLAKTFLFRELLKVFYRLQFK
jgi:hypothetical protein